MSFSFRRSITHKEYYYDEILCCWYSHLFAIGTPSCWPTCESHIKQHRYYRLCERYSTSSIHRQQLRLANDVRPLSFLWQSRTWNGREAAVTAESQRGLGPHPRRNCLRVCNRMWPLDEPLLVYMGQDRGSSRQISCSPGSFSAQSS